MRLRLCLLLVVALTTFSGLAVSVSAKQDASSALSSLGLNELNIEAAGDHFVLPGTIEAGRTLITVENTGDESQHSFLIRLPDNRTVGELIAPSDSEEDGPPSWLFEGSFPGYPAEIPPRESRQAVIDLTPGIYVIIDDFSAMFIVHPGSGEGDAAAPAGEIAADVPVDLFDFNFTLPDGLSSGPHTWQVSNSGPQPHELQILKSPYPDITVEQLTAAMMSETGSADGVDLSLLTPAGGISWLSPGGTAWAEMDLEPGTYIAVCFVFDPAAMTIHAAEGMIHIFTVS